MHRTLKQEATKPAAKNFLQQQGRFDAFLEGFNNERPHEAIGMRYPSEVYRPSPRFYQGIGELDYPFHDFTITVTACGRICIGTRKINLSTAFAGQNVGIRQVDDKIWPVSFIQYDLGFFDHDTCRITSAENCGSRHSNDRFAAAEDRPRSPRARRLARPVCRRRAKMESVQSRRYAASRIRIILSGVIGTIFLCSIRNSSRSTKPGSHFASTVRLCEPSVMETSTASR